MATSALKIGSTVPDFSLPATDGKIYSLKESIKEAAVVIFSCNHCPYVQAYEERIKDIQEEFYSKGLQVIAVNSNDDKQYPDDSFEEMKKRAEQKNFNFPYLRDEDQSVAEAYGATHTPEIFLIDKNMKLVFHGKIDDNWKEPEKVKTSYLREAINELLGNKEISVPETFTIGCTIKWKAL
jgi:peroxiredoxin